MDELTQIAASTVDSRCCVAIEKYPNGQYNKAFLMTMEDGKQVVAKVPNPNAGLARLIIASEVATMKFVPLMTRFDLIIMKLILSMPATFSRFRSPGVWKLRATL